MRGDRPFSAHPHFRPTFAEIAGSRRAFRTCWRCPGLSDADAAAALTHAAAAAVAAGSPCCRAHRNWCWSAGGRHNAAMMAALAWLPARRPVEAGWMATCWRRRPLGWLAVQVLRGADLGPGTTAAPGPVCGDRISTRTYPAILIAGRGPGNAVRFWHVLLHHDDCVRRFTRNDAANGTLPLETARHE